MRIHILGICGTFMGGLATLARALGHVVTGSDANVYPPMSTLLADQDIEVHEGYDPAHLEPRPDLVVIGNALSRGNPEVEAVLARRLPYTSGPQWLAEYFLQNRWVLAVAGTHGKTTTASMLAWILEYAGMAPGFLIGGVPQNFDVSARVGNSDFFVVEADEYDTAFFDKRSKFIHYRPATAVLNNLEFDHADIFPDLAAIQRQFHYFVRTVPGNGRMIVNADDHNLAEVIAQGCWTPTEYFAIGPGVAADRGSRQATWSCKPLRKDYSCFEVLLDGQSQGTVSWDIVGRHNTANALAAVAAARHAGVPVDVALKALGKFRAVKRRMELRGVVKGISVFDDFAHHPTAIRLTLESSRAMAGSGRIIAVLEPRSNTMRMGAHRETLPGSLTAADQVLLFAPADLGWDLGEVAAALGDKARMFRSVDAILDALVPELKSGDHVIIMSNGGFGGIHNRLLERLRA
jgi:UDP-N-acetylmuramate: L-alanyl-gamma-D-glutamyl-meso-diaminopimelate ligase